MPAPERVAQWVSQNYPRPSVDPAWLSDCCDWISTEYNISPSTHFDDFVAHVEAQLLQSNLEDSMVPGTGLNPQLIRTEDPPRSGNRRPTSKAKSRTPRRKVDTGPVPLLVEIRTITEIAHSAFNLLNTHQTRLDREDLGLARGNDEQEGPRHQDEDEGPIPNFPRGMLRLELSDGQSLLRAIEYRSIPDLVLGETPLGYKVSVRGGIGVLLCYTASRCS
ncbi:hypothetical protein ID866_10168 [Astraeus odoratus]|nr:hypothetical protein ID866_10168 [Astraeus odoratus]